jgi:hypothetical protein
LSAPLVGRPFRIRTFAKSRTAVCRRSLIAGKPASARGRTHPFPTGDLRKGCTHLERRAEVTARTRRLAPDHLAQTLPTEAGERCAGVHRFTTASHRDAREDPAAGNLSETHWRTKADRRSPSMSVSAVRRSQTQRATSEPAMDHFV